ncbi:MAG: LpxI family protein [Planctomycetes bacterium]|nr:LpxI family protein [Planctomycetota bacterium]
MSNQQTIGLIAGQGRLPFMTACGAKKAGMKVVCVGLDGSVDPALADLVDVFFKGAVARPGGWMRKLRKHGVTTTIMVGAVAKTRLFDPFKIIKNLPDWRAIRIWYWRLRKLDKRNDTVLNAIAEELASGNLILEDSTMYCKEHLATEGVMTKCRPPASVAEDIEFGWEIVKKIGELDIGQAIVVKEKEVIAVEAIEGTARMLERAAGLCKKGGWTLIKTAKPEQDMRFDVPCIGPDTIKSLAKNGGKCIVVEKGKTIIMDKPQTLELADSLSIPIVGH